MRASTAWVVGAAVALVSMSTDGAGDERYWPQWRGPLLTGVAPKGDPPVEWSESKNVRWKVEIPGKGSATPVVWGDSIFVLTAIPTDKRPAAAAASPTPAASSAAPADPETARRRAPRSSPPETIHEFVVLALDRKDGKVRWRRVVREERPHEGTHPTGTWASSSAVTDGQRVYASFGSRGIYALDMRGNVVWEKDLGDMTTKLGFGEGSSPALHDGKLVLTWDHEGESFIVALDAKTGQEAWRQPRDERTSWATPLVVEHGGKAQVITSATSRVRSYDLASGALLWEAAGMTDNAIPSPVQANGVVYLTSGFRGNALLAVRLAEAKGDVSSGSAIAWRLDRDTPYVPSPLLYEDRLYLLKSNSGILSCLDAKTGERHYGEQRLEGVENVYASPVAAAGRVYVAGREGGTAVVQAGPEFKLLALNKLDDGFDASPVVVDGELYLRGARHLYRISRN
jgi:outer membrane protein assembly factor BamB